MKIKRLFFIGVYAVLLRWGLICYADIGSSHLNDLIKESEVILQARVVQLGVEGIAGYATLDIVEVVKGSYEGKMITVRWNRGMEDVQSIATLDQYRLLFLKKAESGEYTGTHYGRSYWPLHAIETQDPLKRFAFVTPYMWPIKHVLVPETLIKDARVYVEGLDESIKMKVIFLDDIVSTIGSVNKEDDPQVKI